MTRVSSDKVAWRALMPLIEGGYLRLQIMMMDVDDLPMLFFNNIIDSN